MRDSCGECQRDSESPMLIRSIQLLALRLNMCSNLQQRRGDFHFHTSHACQERYDPLPLSLQTICANLCCVGPFHLTKRGLAYLDNDQVYNLLLPNDRCRTSCSVGLLLPGKSI